MCSRRICGFHCLSVCPLCLCGESISQKRTTEAQSISQRHRGNASRTPLLTFVPEL